MKVTSERKLFNLYPSYVCSKKTEQNKRRKDFTSAFDQVSQDLINALKRQQFEESQKNDQTRPTLPDVKFLYNRDVLINMCEKSGVALSPQSTANTEYSLAMAYIGQIKIEKTCLSYRSVNNIVDAVDTQTRAKQSPDFPEKKYISSLTNLKTIVDGNDNSESAYTSYDSLSNLSEDILFGHPNSKFSFLLGENGANQLKQGDTTLLHSLMKQINLHKANSSSTDDVFTFDTIKRYLLSPFVVSNVNGSAASSSNSNMGKPIFNRFLVQKKTFLS